MSADLAGRISVVTGAGSGHWRRDARPLRPAPSFTRVGRCPSVLCERRWWWSPGAPGGL